MLKRIGFILLAIVILVSAVGISARPASASTCTQWYTVKAGDTLNKIGVKYGVSWRYLAQINHISNPNKIFTGQVICVSTTSGSSTSVTPTPYFFITSVVRDKSVTITTYSFPAHDDFKVLMGPMGTKGKNGIKVGAYSSGNGQSKTVTYPIPAGLKGSHQIAIRLESVTGSGFFAYNWFFNNTAAGTSGGGSSGGSSSSGKTPYFKILSVVRNDTVTIQGYNYPANTKFDVFMGPIGTKGIGGFFVTSFNSGAGGTITKTFFIPPELYGSQKISIRTQDKPWYAYNWFWNNTAVAP